MNFLKTRSQHLNWFSLLLLLILVSCNKEDDDCETTEFFNNGDYVFQYSCDGDNIRFFLDIPADTSNNFTGIFPDGDFFRLYVDVNRNGVIDPALDFVVGPDTDNRTCVSFLTSQTSISGCSYFEDVNDVYIWAESENSTEKHVGFLVTVPKEMLSDEGQGTSVVIHIFDAESGYQYFPSNSAFFSDVFEITW